MLRRPLFFLLRLRLRPRLLRLPPRLLRLPPRLLRLPPRLLRLLPRLLEPLLPRNKSCLQGCGVELAAAETADHTAPPTPAETSAAPHQAPGT